jgi:ABC-type spermidine/putrescine transport system permease subunit I
MSQQPSTSSGKFTTWVGLLIIVPILAMIGLFFRKVSIHGDLGTGWTSEHLQALTTGQHLPTLLTQILIAAAIALLALVIALPLAWVIAQMTESRRQTVIRFICIAFLGSFIFRIAGWRMIPDSTDSWLLHPITQIIIMGYLLLPLALLPVLTAVQNFDWRLLDASMDLGASQQQAMRTLFIPGIRSGLLRAGALVFTVALASRLIPDLLSTTGPSPVASTLSALVLAVALGSVLLAKAR